MINEEVVTSRIAELKAEQAQFIAQANQTIAAYNAAIAELERLIAPPQPQPDEAGETGAIG